ncbi:MAG: hypothetical protein PHW77_03295 [Eubacteriales bacterium]|nr:hypothetical protein [Eubacteriales bacterium]
MKLFEKSDLNIFQELVGQPFKNIFIQPTREILGDDVLVVNFGKEIKYSFHTLIFTRIRNENALLFTSSDIYFFPSFRSMSSKIIDDNNFIKKSLAKKALINVRKVLKNAVVSDVQINEIGDIVICFNNGIIIEASIDSRQYEYENYRLLVFGKHSCEHYVVEYYKGKLMFYLSKENF